MKEGKFINKGGIIGSQHTSIREEDLKKIKAIISAEAKTHSEDEKLDTKVFAIKLRMEESMKPLAPEKGIHPGAFIKELISAYNIKNIDFAKYLGYSDNNLSSVYSGKRKVNFELANKLSQIFGIKPEVWLFLQLQHDYQKYQQSNSNTKQYRLRDLIQSKAG